MCSRRDLNGNLRLIRLAPYMGGEHKQNRIEDDDQNNDQNASQQDPTPMHLRELGFHDHTSLLTEETELKFPAPFVQPLASDELFPDALAGVAISRPLCELLLRGPYSRYS